MTSVPLSARLLGFAGLLPFFWGAGTLYLPAMQEFTMAQLGPRFVGPFVLLNYGTIILAFMSGVLWGFATRAEGELATLVYCLSVVPALWAFFFVGGGPVSAAIMLIAGFLAVLAIDVFLWTNELTPRWWLKLRIPLTIGVCACLAIVAFG